MTDTVGGGEPAGGIGPRAVAEKIEAQLLELEAQLASAPAASAKKIRQQIELKRDVLRFCKTRAGY